MEIGVGVQQTQGHTIRGRPAVGKIIFGSIDSHVWGVGGQVRFVPVEASTAIMQARLASHCAQASCAELLNPLLASRLLLGACCHNVFASCVQDSSSSSPKQR